MGRRNREERLAAFRKANREKAAARKLDSGKANARKDKREHAAKLKEDPPCKSFHDSHQQEGSRLMSLPAELRNRIYALALPGPYVSIQKYILGTKPDVSTAPALLLTCKRVHQEAIGIYYSSTIFLNQPSYDLDRSERNDDLERWLRGIGRERVSQIRELWTESGLSVFTGLLERKDDFYDDAMKICLEDIETARMLAASICGRPVWAAEVVKTSLWLWANGEPGTVWTSDPEKLCAEAHAMRCEDIWHDRSTEIGEFLRKQNYHLVSGIWAPEDPFDLWGPMECWP